MKLRQAKKIMRIKGEQALLGVEYACRWCDETNPGRRRALEHWHQATRRRIKAVRRGTYRQAMRVHWRHTRQTYPRKFFPRSLPALTTSQIKAIVTELGRLAAWPNANLID